MDGGDQPPWSKAVQGHHRAVMLRFRPIAPKPANVGPEVLVPPVSSFLLGSKRGRKRKYVRVPKGTNNRRRRARSNRKALPDLPRREGEKVITPSSGEVATLKLLPEMGDLNEQTPPEEPQQQTGSKNNSSGIINHHPCNNFTVLGNIREQPEDLSQLEHRLVGLGTDVNIENRVPVGVVESWVTVEYVMNTLSPCMDSGQASSRVLSFSNEYDHYLVQENERVRDLEADTCPGFVTDASNAVRWVNEAYRRLVAGDRSSADVQVSAWLVIKDEVWPRIGSSSRFSCLVKLRYNTTPLVGQPRVMVVPCDAWRMNFYGGFAWRLDLVAALKLGCS